MFCMSALSAEYRVFTNSQGQSIRAELLLYDARSKMATLRLENGRQAKVPVDKLSEEDQKYIRAWDLNKDFMDERRFKISAKRKRFDNDDKSSKDFNSKRDVENAGYELTLENRSEVDFKKLTIEYCIFYEQDQVAHGGNTTQQGIFCGKTDLDKVPAKAKKEFLTQSVLIYKQELDADWIYGNGADNVQRGDIHGIWLRITMSLPDGDTVVREYCLPDSLSNGRRWTTTSVPVGMNK